MNTPETSSENMPRKRRFPWLQLLRVPNLFTVPGDPAAGYLLASTQPSFTPWRFLVVLLASLFFYMAGLILNDIADIKRDQLQRPQRPLPSHRISRRHAEIAFALSLAIGLLLSAVLGHAALWIGLALAGCILAYNLGLKRVPMLGSVSMGACRAASLLLGAAAAGTWNHPDGIVASAVIGLYVAGVTTVASHDTDARVPGGLQWIPVVVLIGGLGMLAFRAASQTEWLLASIAAAPFLTAVFLSGWTAWSIQHLARMDDGDHPYEADRFAHRHAFPIAHKIGFLLSLLLLLQVSFILLSPLVLTARVAGVVLLASWPLSRYLSKSFYGS